MKSDGKSLEQGLECGDLSPLSPACGSPQETHPAQITEKQFDPFKKPWPHAPVHRMIQHGVYCVTAGTLHKELLFKGEKRLDLLEYSILGLANQYSWQIEAWAAFPNHYHFVCRGCAQSVNLGKFLRHLHANTARELNLLDNETGRKVWHNFWDTRLTYERSYLARLNYVHQNPVHHGVVPVANQYKWCSAAWFERVAASAMVHVIYGLKTDQLSMGDDY